MHAVEKLFQGVELPCHEHLIHVRACADVSQLAIVLFCACSLEEHMLPLLSDLHFAQDTLLLITDAHWRLWRDGAAEEVELLAPSSRVAPWSAVMPGQPGDVAEVCGDYSAQCIVLEMQSVLCHDR